MKAQKKTETCARGTKLNQGEGQQYRWNRREALPPCRNLEMEKPPTPELRGRARTLAGNSDGRRWKLLPMSSSTGEDSTTVIQSQEHSRHYDTREKRGRGHMAKTQKPISSHAESMTVATRVCRWGRETLERESLPCFLYLHFFFYIYHHLLPPFSLSIVNVWYFQNVVNLLSTDWKGKL